MYLYIATPATPTRIDPIKYPQSFNWKENFYFTTAKLICFKITYFWYVFVLRLLARSTIFLLNFLRLSQHFLIHILFVSCFTFWLQYTFTKQLFWVWIIIKIFEKYFYELTCWIALLSGSSVAPFCSTGIAAFISPLASRI